MGCVYLARCTVNGKGYVGKTIKPIEQRRSLHLVASTCNGSRLLFHKAIRKYGESAFEWSVLTEDDDDEWLLLMEQKWIKRLGTKMPGGYNMTDGGEGSSGLKMSDEARRKIGESHRGKKRSPEFVRKHIAFHTGRKRSQSTLDKLSAAMMGRKRSMASREKQKETWKTKVYVRPREAVERTAAAHRGTHCSEETKRKIRLSLVGKMKGIPKSEETKKKMSEAAKNRWVKYRAQKAGLVQACAVVCLSGK